MMCASTSARDSRGLRSRNLEAVVAQMRSVGFLILISPKA
jgi:hypothetical protein